MFNEYVPGPGQYNPNPKKVLNAISYPYTIGSRPKSKGIRERLQVPGPGNYDVKGAMKGYGPKFGRSKRQDLNDGLAEYVPGPGAYNTPIIPSNVPAAPKIR